MSMNNKQRWMGGVVLLGGGVLLAALLLKGNEEIKQVDVQPKLQHHRNYKLNQSNQHKKGRWYSYSHLQLMLKQKTSS